MKLKTTAAEIAELREALGEITAQSSILTGYTAYILKNLSDNEHPWFSAGYASSFCENHNKTVKVAARTGAALNRETP